MPGRKESSGGNKLSLIKKCFDRVASDTFRLVTFFIRIYLQGINEGTVEGEL